MARETSRGRSSTRRSSTRSKTSSTTKRKAGRGFYRGADGLKQANKEKQHQEERKKQRMEQSNKPFRFWVPVGETKEIVILDDKPDFFMYEHQLKNPATGRFDVNTGCVRDYDNCPVCETTGHESYYGMYLSIIDLTPYDAKNGDTVEFSRKLLVVKSGQQKKFIRRFEKEGTLRGAIFEMTRDGNKDPVIGNDIEFLEFMDEDELGDYQRSWEDRDGKTHKEDCSVAYEYEEIFDEPDADELAKIVGAEPSPGSRKANKHDEEEEDEAFDDEAEEAPWDEDEEEEEEEKKPSRRSARSGKAKASRSSSSRRSSRSRDDEEEEDEEEEEEERPSRRRTSSRGSAESKPSGRSAARKRRG